MGLLQEVRAGQCFMKRQIPVAVRFAAVNGVLMTYEGAVPYTKGDALLTGIEGEQWPIAWSFFDATYTPCQGTEHGHEGLYVKKPATVHAVRCTQQKKVLLTSVEQEIQAKLGDWLVADAKGSIWVVAASIFDETYMQVPCAS